MDYPSTYSEILEFDISISLELGRYHR